MPTVTTVILRLLRNEHISSLRGTLQTLDEPEPFSFKDERELLTLLRQLAFLSDLGQERALGQEILPSEGKEP
ncbi:MAG TPA: hypothetical protein G4N94_00365 [Caldilineae bacterium]|nr:hypothetical protein [Caldilineae bacterium]